MVKACKLGVAGGIVWGISMFVCTILAMYTGYSEALLKVVMSIYPGYDISWGGAFLGLGYGFLDAFVGLWLIAAIYNLLAGCCCCKHNQQDNK